jgi:hypothetical protein
LRANGKNYFVIICITSAMTASRTLVKLDRKLCLFVYYVDQINNKEWMVKEATTFNRGVESRMVHDSERRRNRKQCGKFV